MKAKAPTRRKEARPPGAGDPHMRRYTLFSLGIHVLIVSVVTLPWAQRERPILADPLYEVALIQWPEPNFEPPKPAAQKEPTPPEPKPPPPKPEPKIETVAMNEKKAPPKEKPKPKPEPTPPQQTVQTQAPAPQEPVSMGVVDQPDFKHDSYLKTLQRLLARAWEPPSGGEGKIQATVHLIIKKDGTIESPEVVGPSGWTLYDRSTIRAVLTVKKFPPLPQSYPGDQIGLTVDFQRAVEGSS